ncbi:MAG TPA: sulfotransferase domain-containing protein [Terriglobales bacterium]
MANIRRFRANLAKSKVRVPIIWARHRGLYSNDVFLASYPRSGNTWLRFVLGEVLTGKSIEFDTVDNVIPELKWHRRGEKIFADGGRLIKTHEPYRPEYRKALYIVRDARDAALSQYARSVQLGIADPDMDRFLVSFLMGTFHGYGAWGPHIRSWLDSPLSRQGKMLVVKFEDLRKNPEQVLPRMVEFTGKTVNMDAIRAALANNTVEKMQEKEVRSKKLPQSNTEVGRFVRKGAVQGWRDKLTPAQLQLFEKYIGRELAELGYPSASAVADAAAQKSMQPVGK